MKVPYIVLLLFISFNSFGQLTEIPIQQAEKSSASGGRLQAVTSITLPLWDDFSTSYILDTTWWMPESQVQLVSRPGNGILPPSINVVTFDGVDANGNPYSPADTDGPTDSLISRPIDLTQVPTSLRNTVYLSFFYQVKGLGNQPEPEDSLILYFRKKDGSWNKIWPTANDPYQQNPSVFTHKIINVPNDTSYFYDGFQFKFQAIGRQNGWYDNWNLDYVYMDKRRSSGDNSYLDRAFIYQPKSIFGDYTAMPFVEFMYNNDPAEFLTVSSTWIKSLENLTQPIQFTVVVTDTLNQVTIDTIANFKELVLFPQDLKETISNIPNPANFAPGADSLFLEIKYFARTGDKFLVDSIYNGGADTAFYNHINLRVNDTVRSYVTLHDFYAYDDGSAEYGAGINQKDGRIAYQFITKTRLFVNKVDFYFPNISRNQAGSPMEIYVLKDLQNEESSVLGMLAGGIQHTGINEFVTYNFSKPIAVQDTFYIAFRNLADDGLWTAIGLDKNGDTGNKIFYSVDGSWLPNTSVEGNLMIRPHFNDGVITGNIDERLAEISVYPNPTTGRLNIKGDFDHLFVYDIAGRPVSYQLSGSGDSHQLTIGVKSKALVFLVLEKNGQRSIKKIVITN